MKQFKEGDLVKCIDGCNDITNGNIYTVHKVDENTFDSNFSQVYLEGDDRYYYYARRFDLVEDNQEQLKQAIKKRDALNEKIQSLEKAIKDDAPKAGERFLDETSGNKYILSHLPSRTGSDQYMLISLKDGYGYEYASPTPRGAFSGDDENFKRIS